MSTVIPPTVGRKVWVFIEPSARQSVLSHFSIIDASQPFDASIAYVHPNKKESRYDYVTVSIADQHGRMHALTVPLRQEGQPKPDAREWAEWMPFQRGQAKAQAQSAPPAGETADESLIQAAGADRAPRLTPADIDAAIVGESFTILPSQRVTVCEMTLRNGFTVRGESSVISLENFDPVIGQKIARDNARSKVWELEGYLLTQRLFEGRKG